MRSKGTKGRFRKLALGLSACLLFAVLGPLYFADRRDEPFAISSVIASPRDMHLLSAPVQLSQSPHLTITRGIAYAYGPTTANPEAPNGTIVLETPVFTLNVAGLRAAMALQDSGAGLSRSDLGPAAPLIEQISRLGYDLISIRRGTLHFTAADGTVIETLTDIQAEITGRRKGLVAGRGTFMVRGQRLTFNATLGSATDKKQPLRWPLKANLKGGLLQAAFDGRIDVADDVELSGAIDLATPSLRRVGRWFGLPLHTTEGFNATAIKAEVNWAGKLLNFEKAKVTVDGNEANGRLALNLAGDRPLIDATLDFSALNIAPYIEAARVPLFGFELPAASWSSFDLSLPLIRHVDADLRISARKLAFRNMAFGQAGATITAQGGKLQADLTELELYAGNATAQVTAIMSESMPRYALRGKIDNMDAGAAAAMWFGASGFSGRASVTADLTSTGYAPTEIIKRMSGKASLTVAEGRVPIDVKALRNAAKMGATESWAAFAKSPQLALDQLKARALIIDGVGFTESIQARSGNLGLAASGRFGLVDGQMDARITLKANVPTDRPLQAADLLGGDVIALRGPWQEPSLRLEEEAATPPR